MSIKISRTALLIDCYIGTVCFTRDSYSYVGKGINLKNSLKTSQDLCKAFL